jgi:hypothetical protein
MDRFLSAAVLTWPATDSPFQSRVKPIIAAVVRRTINSNSICSTLGIGQLKATA